MSNALPSQPPPAFVRPPPMPGKSGPRIVKCSPARAADLTGAANWFREWCDRNRISVRDLASILDVQTAIAAKKLSGESPVNTADIKRFPPRYRNDLLFAFQSWCASSDAVALHA